MALAAQTSFTSITNGRPSSSILMNVEEMARPGIHAVFQARPMAVTQQVLAQMERRDRIILILQDGRRTIQDVTRLLHRSEVEVAQVLVRLLKQGYIEYRGTRSA